MMENTFDVIVIGSGISGGWAAKEFCEKGMKTLVLERGRNVKHLEDYPTALKNPWDFENRNRMPHQVRETNPIVSRCYAFGEATEHFFLKDTEHPYIQEKPFDWIRGYQVGGKSLLWARQVQRWSKFDFEMPARDGFGAEWPISYDDLAGWYSHVEKFVGISGNKDGLETLPDGEFLPPWEMNAVEKHIQSAIKENYSDRYPIIGRCAHLTEPKEVHLQQGRGQCQARSLCERGCPFGGYFSSNSSTLPWAEKTGNLTLQPDSVVHSIIYDNALGKATGVRVINRLTKETTEYYARVIFLNASTLNSNLVLLNSKSDRFPNGLGNDSGLLGKYMAFHNYRGEISATYRGYEDTYYFGRRPTAVMLPNFRNVYRNDMPFKGGYQIHFTASRKNWQRGISSDQFGADFKENISKPGDWSIYMMAQAETVPKEKSHVRLSDTEVDEWGIPQLITSVDYDENDELLLQDFFKQGAEMLEKAGCENIHARDTGQAPGLDIHEMGGVRMGPDPKNSLLNKWNQLHTCNNVFVTDGACMASTGSHNPSLTFMALTARAANYAVEQMGKGEL
ncbi:MAG: GMC family oxidoreductase [Cyclobacteriaceae bacterium]|nr:GMC family oxidoreductase [Cyclobacteriaceae bacterium SS2]